MDKFQFILLASIAVSVGTFLGILFRTIKQVQKYRLQSLCTMHEWLRKDVQIEDEVTSYLVCTKCGNLAGTDYFEERL